MGQNDGFYLFSLDKLPKTTKHEETRKNAEQGRNRQVFVFPFLLSTFYFLLSLLSALLPLAWTSYLSTSLILLITVLTTPHNSHAVIECVHVDYYS